jgi:DNA-directed RNA polymerase subunit K/omega
LYKGKKLSTQREITFTAYLMSSFVTLSSSLTTYERAKVIGMRAEQIARGAPALIDVPRMMGSRRFDACEVASAELDAGLLPLVVARTLSDGKTELLRIFK